MIWLSLFAFATLTNWKSPTQSGVSLFRLKPELVVLIENRTDTFIAREKKSLTGNSVGRLITVRRRRYVGRHFQQSKHNQKNVILNITCLICTLSKSGC